MKAFTRLRGNLGTTTVLLVEGVDAVGAALGADVFDGVALGVVGGVERQRITTAFAAQGRDLEGWTEQADLDED